jgi:hypothetical protein
MAQENSRVERPIYFGRSIRSKASGKPSDPPTSGVALSKNTLHAKVREVVRHRSDSAVRKSSESHDSVDRFVRSVVEKGASYLEIRSCFVKAVTDIVESLHLGSRRAAKKTKKDAGQDSLFDEIGDKVE